MKFLSNNFSKYSSSFDRLGSKDFKYSNDTQWGPFFIWHLSISTAFTVVVCGVVNPAVE